MKSSRSIATLLVMLIAFGCLIGVQFVRAEGPFDVDNSTGGGRTGTTTGFGDSGQPDGDDEMVAPIRKASAFIGGDWFTGIILRVSFAYVYDHLIVDTPSNDKPSPASVTVAAGQ